MVQNLWDLQVNAIINIKFGDTDTDTYRYEPMTSLLAGWEKIKKYKHGNHCHDKQNFFCRLLSQ